MLSGLGVKHLQPGVAFASLRVRQPASEHSRAIIACLLIVVLGVLLFALSACGPVDHRTTLTIATVNNGDMMVMKAMAPEFEHEHPDIHLKWVVLEENILRQRVTTDVATGAGQFDVVTVGNYEVPNWAKRHWLSPVSNLPKDYDADDILKPVRAAVTWQNNLYALPFYAESAMLYYRTDLFQRAGLQMPAHPTFNDVAALAPKFNDPGHQQYGICLRGKPGWGENIAIVSAMVHAYGGSWFNKNWQPTINSPEWHQAIGMYDQLLRNSGPPGATSNGFNENLALFASGHCAMWIDATVAAGLLFDGKQSQVAGKVGYAPMPSANDPTAPTWLWSWNLAVPSASKHRDAAQAFIAWATSKRYVRRVAAANGWLAAPPGTRLSTYSDPEYQAAAPFAKFVLGAINSALPARPDKERPYRGAQFVEIPEFQAIGTQVGQNIAATLTGQESVDSALEQSQKITQRLMPPPASSR